MRYYTEMTVEEAMKKCGRHEKVLVAVQNLEEEPEEDIVFTKKKREEYKELFDNIKTVASIYDDFVRQLNLFTEKQDIYNIKPRGVRKIVLLKEIQTNVRKKY